MAQYCAGASGIAFDLVRHGASLVHGTPLSAHRGGGSCRSMEMQVVGPTVAAVATESMHAIISARHHFTVSFRVDPIA